MADLLRILHAPLNIANDAYALSQAECSLGNHSKVAVVATPPYGASFDIDLRFEGSGRLSRQVKKFSAARRLIAGNDVLHYCFGRSIVDYRHFELADMKWARRAGKVVAMTFHGCDLRPLVPGACSWCPFACDQQEVRRRIETIERLADLLYVRTPDLLPALASATYVPQAVAGLPQLALREWGERSGAFKVVHAPSDRALKGTDAIVSAVDAVRSRGHDIELLLVEGVSHDQALEMYGVADLAIDQLNAGWYGVFAVEAMAMGIPVICHIDPVALRSSGIDALPVISSDAVSLADRIEDLVARRGSLDAIGQASRTFALDWHNPVRIARQMISDYRRVMDAKRSNAETA